VNTSSLKTIIAVSSPSSLPDAAALSDARARFNVNIILTFGVDETSGVLSVTKVNDFSTLGSALGSTELSISGGSLVVKGFNVSSGYANDATLTKARFSKGEFKTGLAAKLESGNLVLA